MEYSGGLKQRIKTVDVVLGNTFCYNRGSRNDKEKKSDRKNGMCHGRGRKKMQKDEAGMIDCVKEYVMGIDLGTSSVKAVFMDRLGHIAATSSYPYEVEVPYPAYAQQNPEEWWNAARKAIQSAMQKAGICGKQIKGIGFSGQMHGLVALDKKGNVLFPAIIWMDQRTKKEASEIHQIVHEMGLDEELMNQPVAGMLVCSLLWVKRNRPELYNKIAYVILPKDYIRYRLGGTIETDETDAVGSLAFSVKKREWCSRLLKKLDISESLFPPVVRPYSVTGQVSRKAAEETGLREGTILAAGGADSAMQLTGNGIIREGILACNIGTGSQILAVTSIPLYDRKLRTQTLCHSIPGLWYLQGGSLNGGSTLNWLRNRLLKTETSYSQLDKAAGEVAAGCEGLTFLPYLSGERVPYQNPDARGVFFGLTMKQEQAHMVRAVMEGVVLNLRECLGFFDDLGIKKELLIASGGGARGKTWRQIQADVFDMPVYVTKTEEEACTGAAMMAAVGIGWFQDVREAAKIVVKMGEEVLYPIPEHVKVYEEKRQLFRELYGKLESMM